MTTWPTIRAALAGAVAEILTLEDAQVRWSTDSQPVNDLQVRLSVVSEVAEADPRREVAEDLSVTFYESKRIQVEVLIETSGGEYPENTEDAHTLAQKLRLALMHDVIVDAFKEAGIVLSTNPGPIRAVDYEDRDSTYWICARAFELPLRATFSYTLAGHVAGVMTEVIGDGTVDEEENRVEYDVEDPS
jgi:hypothetical protein